MKKILAKLISCVLLICAIASCLTACGGGWAGTSMKEWGTGNIVGGFVGQTSEYVYLINGYNSATSTNTYGVPVRGALIAVDKDDLSKVEVVVPKLMVASDYNAGLYVFGDYVYYGTPSTDKTGSGEIAYTQLTFTKTKLDGTGTEALFVVSGLASEYRMVEKDGVVYVVYYDSTNAQLVSFNTSTKQSSVIAKKDVETEGMLSLNEYKFTENGDQVSLYYSVTVYSEPYIASKAEKDGYERATESYNLVYSYTVGDDKVSEGETFLGKEVLSGKDSETTYQLTAVETGYLFYSQTKASTTTYYALKIADGAKTEIKNSSAVTTSNLVVEESGKLYAYASSGGFVTKALLTEKPATGTERVGACDTVSTLYAVKGGFLYYLNSSNQLARLELNNEDAKEQRISESTINASWYAPQFVTLNGVEYLFYCDNSSTGSSYVKYVNITNPNVQSETDEDDNTTYFFEGQEFMAKISDSDMAQIVTSEINEVVGELVNGALPYEVDKDGKYVLDADGKVQVKIVKEAREKYNNLSATAKAYVTATTLQNLERYEKAIEMASIYVKLEGIGSDLLTAEQLDAYKQIYNQIKAEIKIFESNSEYERISAMLGENMLWNYQKATELFAESK